MNRTLSGVVLVSLLAAYAMPQQAWGLNCNSDNITLSSQAAVDNFQTTYSGDENCDTVPRTLRIEGSDIHDLMPLSGLTVVSGNGGPADSGNGGVAGVTLHYAYFLSLHGATLKSSNIPGIATSVQKTKNWV